MLEAFWNDGWDVHVHVNGDAGLDLVLDQIEAVQAANPQPERRIFMEHYGYARADQHARLAALGIGVSNNAYYAHELPPIYAVHGLGPERAADISPLGDVARAGVPISFHSDFPMAPAAPLGDRGPRSTASPVMAACGARIRAWLSTSPCGP